MRETQINPKREAPAPDGDLNTQLYRAYLAGDGGAVERIMALIQAREATAPDEARV